MAEEIAIHIDASALLGVGRRFEQAASTLQAKTDAALYVMGSKAKDIGEPIMRDTMPHRSGEMAAEEYATVDGGGGSVQADFSTAALSKGGIHGGGAGVWYAGVIIDGRGAVTPHNRALWAADGSFGPSHYSSGVAPYPFNHYALRAMWPPIAAMIVAEADEIMALSLGG